MEHPEVTIFTLVLVLVMVMVFISLVMIDTSIYYDRISQACKDIGMEYHNAMDTKFCVDAFGNAHYAKFTCNGFLWNKVCTAQLISIGDVRVR